MIPISLTIEGLYSYRQKQTIDFEKLTSNQIFGIFGSVGSGKSSILEAIIFVIYNETDRLNLRDNRYYNMMNLQANSTLIDFICWTGKQAKEKYRFIFEAKRSKKRFEEVKVSGRRILKEINGQWIAQENPNITEIIGMNAKNFRQTVIIPQGKFREFIEMSGKDRTEMLQELFHLDRFDLSDKTTRLIIANKEKILTNETKIETLEEFTEETLKEKEKYLEEISTNITNKKQLLEKQESYLEVKKKLKELIEERQKVEKWLLKQKETQEKVIEHKAFLFKYDIAERLFKDKLLQEKKLINQINLQESQIQSAAVQLTNLTTQATQAEITFSEKKSAYEKKDEEKIKLNDLEIIIKIKAAENELAALLQEYKSLENSKKNHFKNLEEAKQGERSLHQKVKSLKKETLDINKLKERELILKQQQQISINLKALQEKLRKLEVEEQQIQEKQAIIIEQASVPKQQEPEVFFKDKLREIEETLIQLASEKKYETDRLHLKDGTPCPLCGAVHHPNIKHLQNEEKTAQNVDILIQEKNDEKLNIEYSLSSWQENTSNLRSLEAVKVDKKKDIEITEKQLKKLESTEKENEVSLNELTQQIQQQEVLFSKLKNTDNLLEKVRDEITKKQHLYDQVNDAFIKIEMQKVSSENNITQSKSLLKLIKYEGKILEFDLSKLNESYLRGEEKITSLERNFTHAEEYRNKILLEKKGLESQLHVERSNLNSFRLALEEIRNTIHQLIDKEESIESLQEIKQLLARDINSKLEKENVESFLKHWNNAKTKVEELNQSISGQTFDLKEYSTLERELQILKNDLQESRAKVAVLKEQIKDGNTKLQQKKTLQEELDAAKYRAENLKVLFNMFKGKGFVKYVSSIYLKNLVAVANKRFMQLTKNNLSLELNDNDDFIVRDYLNNGKTRLLKTLSGGQTFQASLCLALALAEHVKSLNTSEKSFFFLDEGFGTLDKESLHIVFETLRSLQKENRIVGVISHVEELQQEIEVALHVNNHQNSGSVISYSWS